MLTELSEIESDEELWGTTDLTFSIQTRSEDGTELVERTYTFGLLSHSEEWTFQEFEEERTEDTKHITGRQWRRTKKLRWDDGGVSEIEIPPEVLDELEEVLDLDELVLMKP